MRFVFVMPAGGNVFMQMIQSQVAEMAGWLSARRTSVEFELTDVFNPAVLAATLESLVGRYDGAAVVALDHQSVRAAIDDLAASGMHVVTLVSDVPVSRRRHYVGIDNVAAGRTAGALVGRLVRSGEGKIAILAGSQFLRDHAERIFGFQPGTTDTDMQVIIRASGVNPVSQIPRENLTPVAHPAAAIVYLCTSAADDLNGQELNLREETFKARLNLDAA